MKIILLNPPITSYLRKRPNITLDEPLGLAYIASVLIENGFDVDIIDTLINDIEIIICRADGRQVVPGVIHSAPAHVQMMIKRGGIVTVPVADNRMASLRTIKTQYRRLLGIAICIDHVAER